MTHQNETRRAGDAAGLGNIDCLAAVDSPENKPNPRPAQAQKSPLPPVDEARRELLRDFVYEAAEGAIAYCAAIQNFVAADDKAGLKYSATAFVAYARELARATRELIGEARS